MPGKSNIIPIDDRGFSSHQIRAFVYDQVKSLVEEYNTSEQKFFPIEFNGFESNTKLEEAKNKANRYCRVSYSIITTTQRDYNYYEVLGLVNLSTYSGKRINFTRNGQDITISQLAQVQGLNSFVGDRLTKIGNPNFYNPVTVLIPPGDSKLIGETLTVEFQIDQLSPN